MQWVWCVRRETVRWNGAQGAGATRSKPRTVAGCAARWRAAMASAVRAEKLPIDEKTMRSVVWVRAVKRRMASPSWRMSADLVPRMLWPSSDPSKSRSSKVS